MKLTDFLTEVGRPVAYYPELRKITGSVTATILLCQFIYWRGKESDPEGWLYKESSEIEEETGLSYEEQKTARKKLVDASFLEEHYARLDHRMMFKILPDAINDKWGKPKSLVPEQGNPVLGNVAIPCSLNESETTAETTTEIAPEAGGNGRMKDRKPGGSDAVKKGDAIDGMLAFQAPPAGVDFSWLDEYLIPRAMMFWQETKIEPMPDERSFWRKELKAQYEAGITVQQIKTACQRMRKDGLTIKSPASIRAVAKDAQANPPAEPKPLPELPPARVGTPMPAAVRARMDALFKQEQPDEMPTL